MLEALPLGASLLWWSGMGSGPSGRGGPLPSLWKDATSFDPVPDDEEGGAHQDRCRCPDCSTVSLDQFQEEPDELEI